MVTTSRTAHVDSCNTMFLMCSAETTVTNSWGKLCRWAYICLSHQFPGLGYSTLQESESCLFEEDSHIEGDIADDSKPAIDDETHPNWQWPIFDTVHSQYASQSLVRRANKKESKPSAAAFEVIYYNLKDLPWASQVGVRIFSPSLIKVLDELIPEKNEQQVTNRATLAGTELFFIHRNLIDLVEPLSTDASSSADNRRLHLNHLLRFLKQELHDVEEMYESMKSKRKLSWNMLWAFFPPGEIVVYPCSVTKFEVCGKVLNTKYQLYEKARRFIISLSIWDYNCLTWKEYTTTVTIDHFDGDRAFENMETYPIHFKGDPEVIKEAFLQQGSLFCNLSMCQQSNFKYYRGMMFKLTFDRNDCPVITKESADGRVMIDLGSFAKMDPEYELESAMPPREVELGNAVKTIDITSDPNRMFAPAIVYGFSFRLNKWGCFSICGVSNIQFNDFAFDKLIMDEATKALAECVVRERNKMQGINIKLQKSVELDLIAAKGEGCIFLCYGPPGTGKTLTAECLAEKFHRPLWSLSVSELGTTPQDLEVMLMRVMEVAAHWGALLLLDEADVYLERRTSSDLVRNAMAGVFLRQLEYYRGVLFLTTNRDFTFDEAFCSRISVFLRYENLTEGQRNEIWRNILDRSGMTTIPSEEVIAEFARYEFNGREIRNVMQTAQTVARSKEELLDARHIRQALQVLQASINLRASSQLKNNPAGCN